MSAAPLYAGLLSLLYMVPSYRVVQLRGPDGPSPGDSGNPILTCAGARHVS